MRVMVIDEIALSRAIMAKILRKAFAEPVVVRAKSLEDTAARAEMFDLVVLDLDLAGCSGLDAYTRGRRRFPWSGIVIYSANEDPQTIVAALRAGAAGYIPRSSTPNVIIAALQFVAAGGTYIPLQALGRFEAAADAARTPSAGTRLALSERQLQVLRLLLEGCSNRRIAAALALAESTVKYHVHSICAALGASSRGEAIVVALRRKLQTD